MAMQPTAMQTGLTMQHLANKVFTNPEITSFSQDGAQILKDRIAVVLGGGFKTVGHNDLLTIPNQLLSY